MSTRQLNPEDFARLVLLAQQFMGFHDLPVKHHEAAAMACSRLDIDPIWEQPLVVLSIAGLVDVRIWAEQLTAGENHD